PIAANHQPHDGGDEALRLRSDRPSAVRGPLVGAPRGGGPLLQPALLPRGGGLHDLAVLGGSATDRDARGGRMRVLFLHFGKLHVNSVIQAFHLGEEMTADGVEVVLCGQGGTDRISTIGEPSFECINYDGLDRRLRAWARHPDETIVCAWTPREVVRKATERAVRALDAPYVVHLEDNEEHLLSTALRLPYERLRRLPRPRQDELSTDDFVHPAHYPRLLEGAAGVTVITEELNEFNFARRPHHVAPPGVDHERFRPDLTPAVSRESLGLRPGDFALVYHGIGHWANLRELFSL